MLLLCLPRVPSARPPHPLCFPTALPPGCSWAAEAMKAGTGEVVTVVTPRRFRSVGEWYAEFGQLTDSDVLTLLAALR